MEQRIVGGRTHVVIDGATKEPVSSRINTADYSSVRSGEARGSIGHDLPVQVHALFADQTVAGPGVEP